MYDCSHCYAAVSGDLKTVLKMMRRICHISMMDESLRPVGGGGGGWGRQMHPPLLELQREVHFCQAIFWV